MQHVFVWTVGDVMALAFLGLTGLVVAFVFAAEKIEEWQAKRKAKAVRR